MVYDGMRAYIHTHKFWLDVCLIHKHETLSVAMLKRNEIITLQTAVSDKSNFSNFQHVAGQQYHPVGLSHDMGSSAIPNKTLVTIKYFWESVRLSNKSHCIPNCCIRVTGAISGSRNDKLTDRTYSLTGDARNGSGRVMVWISGKRTGDEDAAL